MQDDCRDAKGRFVKGRSGNPRGKPPGSVSLQAALRRELPEREFAKLLAEKVRAGEPWAIQVVADRYWPKTQRLDAEVRPASFEGPRCEPFADTVEIERSMPEALRLLIEAKTDETEQ